MEDRLPEISEKVGEEDPPSPQQQQRRRSVYDLGIGKNRPIVDDDVSSLTGDTLDDNVLTANWNVPEPVRKPPPESPTASSPEPPSSPNNRSSSRSSFPQFTRTRRMVARDEESRRLRAALWDELHYSSSSSSSGADTGGTEGGRRTTPPTATPKTASRRGESYSVGPRSTNGVVGGDFTVGAGTEIHNDDDDYNDDRDTYDDGGSGSYGFAAPPRPTAFHPNIDLSIPESVYSPDGSIDLVWDLLRWEAFQQAQREPLLVSFLHSTILNHRSLESSLAFLLANRLQSAGMISTQLQSIIQDALRHSPTFRRNLRADMMAVRDRDPACNYLPDVFLYFKGFHALQTHRVAHYLWNCNGPDNTATLPPTSESESPLSNQNRNRNRRRPRAIMAKFLQSQVSQMFQIDVHPNATLGSGIMLDHGTGIVIGETATVGHNCSILHHVTLGGSGKKGVKRHPSVGDGVLLGAGATVLGPVTIGTCVEATSTGKATPTAAKKDPLPKFKSLTLRRLLSRSLPSLSNISVVRRWIADRGRNVGDLGLAAPLRRSRCPRPDHRELRRRHPATLHRDGPDDLAALHHHLRVRRHLAGIFGREREVRRRPPGGAAPHLWRRPRAPRLEGHAPPLDGVSHMWEATEPLPFGAIGATRDSVNGPLDRLIHQAGDLAWGVSEPSVRNLLEVQRM